MQMFYFKVDTTRFFEVDDIFSSFSAKLIGPTATFRCASLEQNVVTNSEWHRSNYFIKLYTANEPILKLLNPFPNNKGVALICK
jgi:hypothetical protein